MHVNFLRKARFCSPNTQFQLKRRAFFPRTPEKLNIAPIPNNLFMNELRKDYLVDKWVIIAQERAKRPQEFKTPKEENNAANCFFLSW